jgi:hypothetical protein
VAEWARAKLKSADCGSGSREFSEDQPPKLVRPGSNGQEMEKVDKWLLELGQARHGKTRYAMTGDGR